MRFVISMPVLQPIKSRERSEKEKGFFFKKGNMIVE